LDQGGSIHRRPIEVVQEDIDLLAGFGDGVDDDVAILATGIPPRPGPPCRAPDVASATPPCEACDGTRW
jgi:hypothetical protein